MCNFWSCIYTKSGDVLYDPLSDRHEDIVSQNKLIDKTIDKDDMQFCRVEITPPNGDVFADVKLWTLKVDELARPEWFMPSDEEKCYKVLKQFLHTFHTPITHK